MQNRNGFINLFYLTPAHRNSYVVYNIYKVIQRVLTKY